MPTGWLDPYNRFTSVVSGEHVAELERMTGRRGLETYAAIVHLGYIRLLQERKTQYFELRADRMDAARRWARSTLSPDQVETLSFSILPGGRDIEEPLDKSLMKSWNDDDVEGIVHDRGGAFSLVSPSPFLYRVKGSYFGECERDDQGHCLPSGQSGQGKPEEGKNPESVAAAPSNPREFEEWFGNSKIVNTDGSPKLLYRGTSGDTLEPYGGAGSGNWIFLTGKWGLAEQYARQYDIGKVHALYVKAEHPIDISSGDGYAIWKQYRQETNAASYASVKTSEGMAVAWTEERRFREWLDKKGIPYDAIYFGENDGSRSLAVQSTDQLRKADDKGEEQKKAIPAAQEIPPSPFRKRLDSFRVKGQHSPEDDPIKVHLPDLQQTRNYTCGASAMASICEFFGVGPETEIEFADLLDSDPEEGTNPQRIIDLGMSYGLGVEVRQGMTIEDLKKHLDQEHPILVLIQAWGDEADEEQNYPRYDDGHYVVVVGYDKTDIYVEDPSLKGVRGTIPQKDFLERWHDEGRGKRYERWGAAFSKQHEYEEVKHLTKGEGTCEPGQTAAQTGCTPASGDGGMKPEKVNRERSVEQGLNSLNQLPDEYPSYFKEGEHTSSLGNKRSPFRFSGIENRRSVLGKFEMAGGFGAVDKSKVRKVNLSDLISTDPSISIAVVEDYLSKPLDKKSSGIVVKFQGKLWIVDGHHRLSSALLRGEKIGWVQLLDLDQKEQQIKPSPFRKRLPLMQIKNLSYLDETAGGAVVPPPEQPPASEGIKDAAPKPSALERAEHSDLITLPDGIIGTNCGNCAYIRETFCVHPEVNQEVSPRMCCAYWDAPGTHRAWLPEGGELQENGKKNAHGFLTKVPPSPFHDRKNKKDI